MTCIVGIARDGVVHIGADHAVETYERIRLCPQPKVAKTIDGMFVIGYSGRVHEGVGLLENFDMDVPKLGAPPEDVAQQICDYMTRYYGASHCTCFYLIGHAGHLYTLFNVASYNEVPMLLCLYTPEQYDCIGTNMPEFDKIIRRYMKDDESLTPQSLISLTIFEAARLVKGVSCFDNGPTIVSL